MPIYLTDAILSAAENGVHDVVERVSGLKKREIFAAMAMQGLLSHNANWRPVAVAETAAAMADALLTELERAK